jgi:hypothetical protein
MRPDGAHTHGGGSVAGVAGVLVVGAVVAGVCLAARAVAAVPWWVWATLNVTVVAAIAGGVRLIWLLHRPPPPAVQEAWHARAEATRQHHPALPAAPVGVSETPPTAVLPPVQIHHHWHDVSAADVAAVLLSKDPQKGNDQCSG